MLIAGTSTRFYFYAIAAMFFLFLCILELTVVSEPAWISPQIRNALIFTAAIAIVLVPISTYIRQNQRRLIRLLFSVMLGWLLFLGGLFAYVGADTRFIGLLEVLVLLGWLIGWLFLRFKFERSVSHARLNWYEGKPRTIPHLRCQIEVPNDKNYTFSASRFDLQGAFLFPDKNDPRFSELNLNTARVNKALLCFKFRDKILKCQGRLTKALDSSGGLGFRFMALSPDQKKDLGDMIERLRGDGYEV